MIRPNDPALQTSDINPFLFADVGIEPNGSNLTVLSLLARLDVDPWSEARRLAELPRNDALDCLRERIARTPLSPDNQEDGRSRAARLVSLLPAKASILARALVEPRDGVPARVAAIIGETPAMRWTVFAVIWGFLVIGAATSAMHAPIPPLKTSAPVPQHAR